MPKFPMMPLITVWKSNAIGDCHKYPVDFCFSAARMILASLL